MIDAGKGKNPSNQPLGPFVTPRKYKFCRYLRLKIVLRPAWAQPLHAPMTEPMRTGPLFAGFSHFGDTQWTATASFFTTLISFQCPCMNRASKSKQSVAM